MARYLIMLVLSLVVAANTFALEVKGGSAEKKIVRITKGGLVPSKITLTKQDSSIFFYNDTGFSEVSVAIKFGANRLHCHSGHMELQEDGYLRTTAPLLPNSFVIACFPELDTYDLRVALPGGKELTGLISVQ